MFCECGRELDPRQGASGRGQCSRCYQREYRKRNRDKVNARRARWRTRPEVIERERQQRRGYRLRGQHGLTGDDLAALLETQGGKCYLCGDPLALTAAEIEHDHRCCPRFHSCQICRRGLACHMCNKLAGFAYDDPGRLRRIADALETATGVVTVRMKGGVVHHAGSFR